MPTPSDAHTGHSASVARGRVPSWATTEQVADWKRRIKREPVRVLVEVATVWRAHGGSGDFRGVRGDGLVALLGALDAARTWVNAIYGLRLVRAEIVEELQGLPDQDAALAMLGSARLTRETSLWTLASRLDAKSFVALYCATGRNPFGSALRTLPDVMLRRAAAVAVAGGAPALRAMFRVVSEGRAYRSALPLPSQFFPGLDAVLDDRLLNLGHATNVDLLDALAAAGSWQAQREYLNLYITGGRDAADAWQAIPIFKRGLVAGTDEDQLLWKLLRVYGTYVRVGSDAMGIIAGLTGQLLRCPDKLSTALGAFASTLAAREPVDWGTAPWEYKLVPPARRAPNGGA